MRALLILSLLVACEPPESKNPISDPHTAKSDPRLLGTWMGHMDQSDCFLHVVPAGGARVDVVLVAPDRAHGAVTLHFSGFASTVGGKSYLNLQRKRFDGRWADKSELEPAWILARYAFGRDGQLTLSYLDDDAVKKHVAAGELEGAVRPDGVQLTASTASLVAFFEHAHDPKLFVSLGTRFRRMR